MAKENLEIIHKIINGYKMFATRNFHRANASVGGVVLHKLPFPSVINP
jgi:hypothetical protein